MNIFWSFSKRYIIRYSWWFLVGFTCVFLTQLLAVQIIDQIRQAIDAMNTAESNSETVIPFVWTIIAFALALVLVRTISRLVVFTPGRLAEYHIRNDYYSRLLELQRDFLSKHSSGDLVSRCSNDINYIRAAYGFGGLQLAHVSITMVLVIYSMLQLDPKTTLYLAIPMIISFVIIQSSIRYLFPFMHRANELVGDMSAMVLSSYKGVAAIQNYHAETKLAARFDETSNRFLSNQAIIIRNRSFVMPLVELVGNISIFTVLFLAGSRVIDGNLSLGQISAFLGYVAMIMPPLLSLGWMLNVFSQSIPAMKRLDEILLAQSSLLPSKPAANLTAGKPVSMVVDKLSFSYPKESDELAPFQLQDVSIDLAPGKILGIVGGLGCGKTTLLDSIMRLNGTHPGHFFLNGHDAAYVSLEDFRCHFSYAPQQAFLFSNTLRENLLVAVPADQATTVGDDHLIRFLDYAGFDLNEKQFPEGLDTEVGQKGVMLSGGQRQRIALARALMKDANIYVLDDVLSAVDHDTEKRIVANIQKYAKGKAFIIASHRVSAVQWADEILVMDKGRIIDRGSHEALSGRPGFYQDINNYQSSHEVETSVETS